MSCADGERDNPYDPGSKNYVPWGSSSSKQSSSSSATYTLACAAVPSTGIVSTTIIPPVVTCNGIVVGYGLDWTNAPDWNNPAIGTYRDISVLVSYGECSGKTASCSGALTVIAVPSADELTCTGMPMTGVAGTAITQPTVRCGNNEITTGITWVNAPAWFNPSASTYNVSATASCGGSVKTASCGRLTVASVLACGFVPPAGMVGTAITAPTVTCDGKTVSSGLDWEGAPNWSNPRAGTYSYISVYANSGNCSGETAECSGTLIVNAVYSSSSSNSSSSSSSSIIAYTLTCASVPTTGTAGTAITAPTVTCSSNNTSSVVSSGLTWTDAPNWSNPAAGTYSGISVSASSGNCSGKTATCSGTLTVATPVTYTLTCANVPTIGAAGTAITPPVVTCTGSNGTSTNVSSSNLTWADAPNWGNLVGDTYSNISVAASSGNCSGKTATCSGTLIVQSGVISGTPVTYEGETYQTVVIGTQTWMARNLNYDASGSKCYNNSEANCAIYGRLYVWATAMNLPSSCIGSSCASQVSAKHRGICPSGWHIPSYAEWTTLMTFVGSSAGTKLKARDGWNDNGNGTDVHGFSALPGEYGNGTCGGCFDKVSVGDYGLWWTATESNANAYHAYSLSMGYNNANVNGGTGSKAFLYSVRCVQD